MIHSRNSEYSPSLFISHMHQLIRNFQEQVARCEQEHLCKFLMDKIQNVFKLIDESYQTFSTTNIVNKLNIIEKDVIQNWRKQYNWYDIVKIKAAEKKLVTQFSILLQLLQRFVLFRFYEDRFDLELINLNQQAEKTKLEAEEKIQKNLTDYQADYLKFKKKLEEAQHQCQARISELTQQIIEKRMAAYAASAIHSAKLEQLEELSNAFSFQVENKRANWPDKVIKYYAALSMIQETMLKKINELENKKNDLIQLYGSLDVDRDHAALLAEQFTSSCDDYLNRVQALEMFYKKHLDTFENIYELNVKQYIDSFDYMAQSFIAKVNDISATFDDLTEEQSRAFLRSVQNDPDIKSILHAFQRECDIQIEEIKNKQQIVVDSIANSSESMQLLKKEIHETFEVMLRFKKEADTFYPLLSESDQCLQAAFFVQLFKMTDDLQKQWDRDTRSTKARAQKALLKLDQPTSGISNLKSFCPVLREQLLTIAKEKLAQFVKQTVLQFEQNKYPVQLERKKQEVHGWITSTLNKLFERPIHKLSFTPQINNLHTASFNGCSRNIHELLHEFKQRHHLSVQPNIIPATPVYTQKNKKKSSQDAFFKRLFTKHWKVMVCTGLIVAIIAGSILTGGLLASTVGMAGGGTGLLAIIMGKSLGTAIMIGSMVTTSSNMATIIGVTLLSIGTGVIAGIKVGFIVTMCDDRKVSKKTNSKEPPIEMMNLGAGFPMSAGQTNRDSYYQVNQQLKHVNAKDDRDDQAAVLQPPYAGMIHSHSILRTWLGLFCCGHINDRDVSSEHIQHQSSHYSK